MERVKTRVKRLWHRQPQALSPHSVSFPQECYDPPKWYAPPQSYYPPVMVPYPPIQSERVAAREGALHSLDPRENTGADVYPQTKPLPKCPDLKTNRPRAIPLFASYRYSHHITVNDVYDHADIQLELPAAVRELVGVWARQLCQELGNSCRDLTIYEVDDTEIGLPVEVVISMSCIDYPGLNPQGYFRVLNTYDHRAALNAVREVVLSMPSSQLQYLDEININYMNGIISNANRMAICHVDPRQWIVGGGQTRQWRDGHTPKVRLEHNLADYPGYDISYTGSTENSSMFSNIYGDDIELVCHLLVYLEYS